jgi:hypothetical protein
MKSSRKMSCSVGCLSVSKILSSINPAVPNTAKAMLNPLIVFWKALVLGTKLPECRRYLSEMNDASRKIVVTTEPAMKSGFRDCAPTSEMYAIEELGAMGG